MKNKKLFLVLSVLVLAALSCRLFIPGTPPPDGKRAGLRESVTLLLRDALRNHVAALC